MQKNPNFKILKILKILESCVNELSTGILLPIRLIQTLAKFASIQPSQVENFNSYF